MHIQTFFTKLKQHERFVFISLFILAAVLPYFLYLSSSIFIDEAVFMFIGNKILHGAIPYKDYIDNKPPGIFYLLASVFFIFGKSVYVARSILYLFNILSAIILFLIGKRLWNEKVGMLSSILFLIGISIPAFHGYYAITDPFMVFFSVLGVFFFFQFKKHAMYLILSGIAVGLSMLFKQFAGLLLLTIFIFYISKLWTPQNRTRAYLKESIRSLLLVLFGFLIPILLVALYFWSVNTLFDMVYWVIIAPLNLYEHLHSLSRLGYGFMSYSVVWVFSFVSVIAIIYEFITKKSSDKEIFMVIWWIFSLYPLTIRISGLYFILILPPACLLASISLIKIYPMLCTLKISGSEEINYLKIFAIICSFSLIFSTVGVISSSGYLFQKGSSLYFNEQMQTADYIRSHTAENEKIFVFIFEPSIYFLSDRDPPTEYIVLGSRMFYDENTENRVIEQIKVNNVTYIVVTVYRGAVERGVIERVFGGKLARSPWGAPHIYEFIQDNYKIEKSIGPFDIYRKTNTENF